MRTLLIVLALLAATGCQAGSAQVPFADRPPPAIKPQEQEEARWRITERGGEHEIEGYADRVSVLPGERFALRVSTTAKSFTATAFRMGAPVTKVWTSPRVAGRRQAPARTRRGMVSAAHWKPSLTVETGGWPEGSYLIRLDANTGAQRYVPITLRSASARGRVVIVNAVTTWQAYNRWGGTNLYEGPAGRSHAVTFDRPYDTSGARLFLDLERDAIEVAERSGVPLAYLTSLDLNPGSLDGAAAMVSLGHDEYWSAGMRETVTRARDAGVNLAFLGANAVYWRIKVAGRVVECDKGQRCPLWRTAEPESSLIGQMYDCFPAEAAYVVREPDHWIFKGTKGRRFPGLAGVETDKVSRGSPDDVQVLAESPVDCGGRRTVAHTTFYTAPSGAGVFASGTMRWVCGMRGGRCGHGVTNAAAPFTRRATTNVLRAFAQGPYGRR